jgi:acetyl esterase/lipase
MIKNVKIERTGTITMLATEIVYGQRIEWSTVTYKPLYLSLMKPRLEKIYDKKVVLPLIVWICGGGFTQQDRNAWLPELAWYVKQGYAVAGVDYSTSYRTRFPMAAEDIKLAIRFLKAHGTEFNLDTSRIAIMGESAGGYLTAFCALTGNDRQYDNGGYEEYSSEVQAAIPWYPPAHFRDMEVPKHLALPGDLKQYPDLTGLAARNVPPFLILHGTGDREVPLEQGRLLHDTLEKAGADVEMVILEGAEHTDPIMVEDETKQIILSFLKRKLCSKVSQEGS